MMTSELFDGNEWYEISPEEARAVHGIMTGPVRERAVERGRQPKLLGDGSTEGFCVMANRDPYNEGGTDSVYVGVISRQDPDVDTWYLGVSVYETHADLNAASRRILRIVSDGEEAYAAERVYGHVAHPSQPGTREGKLLVLTSEGPVGFSDPVQVTLDDIDDITNRVLTNVFAAGPHVLPERNTRDLAAGY